jgi:hypothetical protein
MSEQANNNVPPINDYAKQTSDTPHRVEALREAARITTQDRNANYGGPEENFTRTAKIWSVILGQEITNEQVAMMMVGLKMARFAHGSGFQPDTWIDIAGYAGCGYEVGKIASEQISEFFGGEHVGTCTTLEI